jgi:uncharacterized RDD family membrane protein YckC
MGLELPGIQPRWRRDTAALSTFVNPAKLSSTWKQEVNRRVAEHRSRKGCSAAEPKAHAENQHGASRRAVDAAARVAARFAQAPSYSEMLADEARAALRAAEAASDAALMARAAAQSVLEGIEAAASADAAGAEPFYGGFPDQEEFSQPATEAKAEPAWAKTTAESSKAKQVEPPALTVRWDPEAPPRPARPAGVHAAHGASVFAMDFEEGRSGAVQEVGEMEAEEIEPVEPAQPIPANLIEFPRELVATRKMRPRLAEGPYATTECGAQLSIFEVDPGAISLEPAADDGDASATAWVGPQWSGIELEAQPEHEAPAPLAKAATAPGLAAEAASEPEAGARPESAPFHLRLMAAVVDVALITGAFLASATVAASHAQALPAARQASVGAILGLAGIGFLYYALFSTLGWATPGMCYARIRLRTLDGQIPTRRRRIRRLTALVLSLAPVGLGVAWMLFDDESLSWHDRLSGTRLCKN